MSGPGELEVETLGGRDVVAMAELHARVFPDSVLTRLGTDALGRYYRWQVEGPHQVEAFGVRRQGRLLGLVVGGRFRGSMIGFVKHNSFFLAGRVARHPGLLVEERGRRAVRSGLRLLARRSARTRVERPERVPDRSFGLLLVAVDPEAQRSGLGRTLLEEAERRATLAGRERLHLTLDPTNWGAMAFYTELGWQRLGVPGDTDRQWLMYKELPREVSG